MWFEVRLRWCATWRLAASAAAVTCALLLQTAMAAPPAAGAPRESGATTMSAPLQALQRDDTQNPAMLWVKAGREAWSAAPADGRAGSCAQCHGDAATSMRGVAARHPQAVRSRDGGVEVQTLAQRIEHCRVERQSQAPSARESATALGLEAFVALQSRGLPIAAPAHPQLDVLAAEGAAWFSRRMGQLNLSCAQCHDERAGRSLGGSSIPQGHPTGYPIYRLEWQGVGSLNRRLRACMVGVRAEPFAHGSSAWLALEVYLMRRASGMPIETPAVRP